MPAPEFVHIHQHSVYSSFDGLSSIKGIVGQAKKFGMRACGLTDHGTFAGAVDFLRECRDQGVRPILGMEAYMARDHKTKSKDSQTDGRRGNKHINLIAKNMTGFQNICELSQMASIDGFYYDPRVDYGLFEDYSEGVICTTACLSNVVNSNLAHDQYDQAKKAAGLLREIFKEDFYMEMMFHGIPKEGRIMPLIEKLSKSLGIKAIATNDNHYLHKEDAEHHEILMCMSSGRTMDDPKRLRFPFGEFYFKSAEEMYKVFRSIPYAMTNTLEVAEKCDYSDIWYQYRDEMNEKNN